MKTLQEVENEHIKYVLNETGGKLTKSADILGISRATLYRKIKGSRELQILKRLLKIEGKLS